VGAEVEDNKLKNQSATEDEDHKISDYDRGVENDMRDVQGGP
jgi:hypothetical protein